MTIGDYPHISASAATSSQYNLGAFGNQMIDLDNKFIENNMVRTNDPFRDQVFINEKVNEFMSRQRLKETITQTVKELQMTRRLVQVYIADPDENVPLDKSLIYSGEQKLTDATDQELFHEIEIARILKEHNEYRTKLVNKKVKERTEYLEPARIRDLKMVVVVVAQF